MNQLNNNVKQTEPDMTAINQKKKKIINLFEDVFDEDPQHGASVQWSKKNDLPRTFSYSTFNCFHRQLMNDTSKWT